MTAAAERTAPAGVERLVDERTGVVRALEPRSLHPNLPRAVQLVAARVGPRPGHGRWGHEASPGGAAWWDRAAARAAALGEAAERYCAAVPPPPVRLATFDELAAEGVDAVDPMSLALYSDDQYARPGFPFVRFGRDLPVEWVEAGEPGGERGPVLVPRSLTSLGYGGLGPNTHLPINSGLAAAADAATAGLAALEEVLERHSVATAWLSGARLRRSPVPTWLTAVLGGRASRMTATVLAVPNEFDLPVAAVLLGDRETGILGMGTALRPRWTDAVAKAAVEAVVSCQAAHELDDRDLIDRWLAESAGTGLVSWRSDRSYRQAYRNDWRDVVDVFCHVQLYLDPAMQDLLADRLGDAPVAPPVFREVGGRDGYLGRVRWSGRRVLIVDLDTADVRACGLRVRRVVVPGLRSTAPAAFPLLGGPPGAGGITDPDLLPLPHA